MSSQADTSGIRRGSRGIEEECVEAEIERLLRSVNVDDEDCEIGLRERGHHPNFQAERTLEASDVNSVFSGYLSSRAHQRLDLQDVLSNAYSVLHASSDITLEGDMNSSESTSSKQVCNVQLVNVAEQSTTVQTSLSGKETNNEHKVQYSPPPNSVSTEILVEKNFKEVEIQKPIDSVSCSEVQCHLRDGGCNEKEQQTATAGIRPLELQSVMDQLEVEQNRWEEQLAREQGEREAEITHQIEEIQKWIDEKQKEKIAREEHLERVKQDAAVTLQAYWRGYSVRQLYHDRLLQRKQLRLQKIFKAAQLLQASWRGFATRREFGPTLEGRRLLRKERFRQEEITRNHSATVLQAHWRGYHIRCICQPTLTAAREKRAKETLKMKEEISRKCNLAATMLQSLWRGYLVRKTYGAVLIKRIEESRKEMHLRRQNAAAVLQACWRGHCVRQKVKMLLLEQRNERRVLEEQKIKSVIILQAQWRGHACRVRHRQILQQACSTMDGESHCVKREDLDNPCVTGNCSDQLMVTKQLKSALKVRSPNAVALVENESHTPGARHSQNTSHGSMIHKYGGKITWALSCGERSSSEEEDWKDSSEVKPVTTSLVASRHLDDDHRCTATRSSAMTYWDTEKVGHSLQHETLSGYVREQGEDGTLCLPESNVMRMTKQIKCSSITVQGTNKVVAAALVLQSAWRGRAVRLSLAACHCAAVRIQAAWKRFNVRRVVQLNTEENKKRSCAATIIQAAYRGYWIRCRLCKVVQGAQYVSEEENSLEDDFELNLTDDDLVNETVIPRSPPTPTSPPNIGHILVPPQCPNQHYTNSISSNDAVVHEMTKPLHDPVRLPTQAWSGMEDSVPLAVPSSPVLTQLPFPEDTSKSEGTTLKERIIHDWGFKTDNAVHLMLKRAKRQKKFKNKAAQRKKMSDPTERLAAFHKHGVSTSTPDNDLHKWSSLPMKTHQHTQHEANPFMYQWCHDSRLVHEEKLRSSCSMTYQKLKKARRVKQAFSPQGCSEWSLPQLDQRVLAGHAPTLVNVDGNLDKGSTSFPAALHSPSTNQHTLPEEDM